MKKIIFLITIIAFVACQSSSNKEKATETAQEVVEATVYISGMHCNNCVASVEKGINGLEGIENVVVSLNDSNAIVKYNAQIVDVKEIEAAIVKRGYKIKK